MPAERKTDPKNAGEEREKIKIYAAIAVVLVLLAVVSTLIPRGSPLQQCLGTWIAANKYACLSQLAQRSMNASICAYLPSPGQGQCYVAVAEGTDSAATCTRASTASLSGSCLVFVANATNDYATCGMASGNYSTGCYAALAIKNYNQSACTHAGNQGQVTACTSAILTNQALLFGRPSYCAEVSNSTNKGVTIMTLENLTYGSNNSRLYSGLSTIVGYASYSTNETVTARDACYLLAAGELLNGTYCNDVTNSGLVSYCNNEVGTVSGSAPTNTIQNYTQMLNQCRSVQSSYSQSCVYAITLDEALATRNASLCATIPGGNASVYQCYVGLAIRYNDTAYCGLIKNSSANSACVSDISYNTSSYTNP